MPAVAMPDNSAAEAVSIRGNSSCQGLTLAITRALARLALSDKELADALHLNPSQFYRQREGQDGHYLHVQRFDLLPEGYHGLFLDALLDELAQLRGRVVVTPMGQHLAMARALRAMGDAVEALSTGQPQAALPFERGA